MRALATAFAIVACGAASDAQQPAPPTIRAVATGPWFADHDDSSCDLARTVMIGSQRAWLKVRLEPQMGTVWLRVQDKGRVHLADGEAAISVDGRELPSRLRATIWSEGGDRTREYRLDPRLHRLDQVQSRLRLTVGADDLELDVDRFDKGRAALTACLDDLHRSLGVDRADIARVATPPTGDIVSLLPYFAGGTNFAVFYWIDATGRVEGCRLVSPSGHPAIDNSLCAAMQSRAPFSARARRGGDRDPGTGLSTHPPVGGRVG